MPAMRSFMVLIARRATGTSAKRRRLNGVGLGIKSARGEDRRESDGAARRFGVSSGDAAQGRAKSVRNVHGFYSPQRTRRLHEGHDGKNFRRELTTPTTEGTEDHSGAVSNQRPTISIPSTSVYIGVGGLITTTGTKLRATATC